MIKLASRRTSSARCIKTLNPRIELDRRSSKEAVRRARQAEILPKRGALVVAAKEPAPLQLGRDTINKIVGSAGKR